MQIVDYICIRLSIIIQMKAKIIRIQNRNQLDTKMMKAILSFMKDESETTILQLNGKTILFCLSDSTLKARIHEKRRANKSRKLIQRSQPNQIRIQM